MDKFSPINLTRYFNSAARLVTRKGKKALRWHKAIEGVNDRMLRGRQELWGIPFRLGPKDLDKKGLIVLGAGSKIELQVNDTATHLCVLHFCNIADDPNKNAAGGEHLADYVIGYADGTQYVQPIRRRFEINPFSHPWGGAAFAAAPSGMPDVPPNDPTAIGWGRLQTGTTSKGGSACASWIYAVENPHPGKRIANLVLRSTAKEPVAVLGITLYRGPGHPLRHVPRRLYRLLLPGDEKALAQDIDVQVDMGIITRKYAVPGRIDDAWLKAPDAGLGRPQAPGRPSREVLLEATGALGATVRAKTPEGKARELSLGEAFQTGRSRSADRKAVLEIVHPRTTWLHVTVVDGSTGKPTPTRIQFLGRHGEYIPPYGHHAVVNDAWFEDYGGDLKLGSQSYAYVPGRFQVELPVGEVYVEASKGFEYEPLRQKLDIRPGQRELKLTVRRRMDWRSSNWVTADTHVHFISPQTAWLEGQAEGVNLINLLASQWGRLFTNVGDITGELSGCSADDTLVWVGTENRHHLLGHMSMLGAHGEPVFPMCAGGPGEAYIGDPDVVLLTEWAEQVRAREGVAIRPHFPSPICEEPVYFLLGQIDGAELRRFASPAAETLDEFCFTEWYRYLNCGCRVAAVGGTDKMSAGMPVGGVRTYARLAPDQPFTFENWAKAVRAGRTFTTSGPLIDLRVDGRSVGDEIRMSSAGTVEVEASAECIWPVDRLEVVMNGKIVASTSGGKAGARRLRLRTKAKIEASSWLAARCSSRMQVHHCWPIQLGAHTSPVYITVGGRPMFSPSDASYMLTLIDGGLAYLDTLSVRYEERRHREMKAIFERARQELHRRAHEHELAHA